MATTLLNNDFSFNTLVEGINSAPVNAGPVMRSDLFGLNPISSTDVSLELVNDELTLIPTSLRGSIGDLHPITNRSMLNLKTSHIRTSRTMLADSWISRAGFNQGGTPANVLLERDRVLAEMSARIRVTQEYMATRALNGQILDADGSVIVDLFAEFGQVQSIVECDLDVSTTNLANRIVAARRLAEAALGVAFASEWVIFASAQFIDAARAHASYEAATAGWSAATSLLADNRDGAVVVAGARLIECPNLANKTFIDAGAAFLCPMGVAGLATMHFGPGNYVESVGELGLPIMAKADELALGKGIIIEAQSNPLPIISRPRAIVRLNA
jgi:hypothetical protein